jgi:beta-phosphoglucomutase
LKPKALIFDMDGVLVDSEPLHERAKREAFRKAGIVLPEERFATLIGHGDEAMLKELASEFSLSAEQSAEILRQKNAFYESSESTLRPIPGALDFVHWSHRHFRLALATSASPRYRHFLMKKFDIESLFEFVVDAALVKAPKPSPEVFEITLKKTLTRTDNMLDHRGFYQWPRSGETGWMFCRWDYNQFFEPNTTQHGSRPGRSELRAA